MCGPPHQWHPCFCRAKDRTPQSPELLSSHALAVSVCRDVQQHLTHPGLPRSPLESPDHSSSSGVPTREMTEACQRDAFAPPCSDYAEHVGWLEMRDTRGDQPSWGAHPPHGIDLPLLGRIGNRDRVNSPLSTAQGRQPALTGSWQEDGGAEGMQQSLHHVYQLCLKHEAKPFIYGLADVQNFDHGDCC